MARRELSLDHAGVWGRMGRTCLLPACMRLGPRRRQTGCPVRPQGSREAFAPRPNLWKAGVPVAGEQRALTPQLFTAGVHMSLSPPEPQFPVCGG